MYYYINSEGQQAGPVPAEQLVANGVTANTLVWKEGISQWTKASDVPELRFLFDPNVPPPAPSINTNTPNSTNGSQPKFLKVGARILFFVSLYVLCGCLYFIGLHWDWAWIPMILLGYSCYILWKTIPKGELTEENKRPLKAQMLSVGCFLLLTLMISSVSNRMKYGDLFDITDEFVDNLQTEYESYGMLGGVGHTKYTNDKEYKVAPIGRLINVRIERTATDEEYEELREALESHYSGDSRVNQVYLNGAGTIMIDCRN